MSPPFATSEAKATSIYLGRVGDVFYDPANPQNAYMLVDCQSALITGEIVVINESGQASKATSTSVGLLGVMASDVSASDFAAWAQIEGSNATALATSGATTAGFIMVPVTTDYGYVDILTTTEANAVFGARLISAPDTATTAGDSGLGGTAILGLATIRMKRGGAFVYGLANNHGLSS
jgi:hypothetical protein